MKWIIETQLKKSSPRNSVLLSQIPVVNITGQPIHQNQGFLIKFLCKVQQTKLNSLLSDSCRVLKLFYIKMYQFPSLFITWSHSDLLFSHFVFVCLFFLITANYFPFVCLFHSTLFSISLDQISRFTIRPYNQIIWASAS